MPQRLSCPYMEQRAHRGRAAQRRHRDRRHGALRGVPSSRSACSGNRGGRARRAAARIPAAAKTVVGEGPDPPSAPPPAPQCPRMPEVPQRQGDLAPLGRYGDPAGQAEEVKASETAVAADHGRALHRHRHGMFDCPPRTHGGRDKWRACRRVEDHRSARPGRPGGESRAADPTRSYRLLLPGWSARSAVAARPSPASRTQPSLRPQDEPEHARHRAVRARPSLKVAWRSARSVRRNLLATA